MIHDRLTWVLPMLLLFPLGCGEQGPSVSPPTDPTSDRQSEREPTATADARADQSAALAESEPAPLLPDRAVSLPARGSLTMDDGRTVPFVHAVLLPTAPPLMDLSIFLYPFEPEPEKIQAIAKRYDATKLVRYQPGPDPQLWPKHAPYLEIRLALDDRSAPIDSANIARVDFQASGWQEPKMSSGFAIRPVPGDTVLQYDPTAPQRLYLSIRVDQDGRRANLEIGEPRDD